MQLPIRRHNNLVPIMHHFRDIAGFCAPHVTPYFYLGVFPLDQIAHVGVSPSIRLKLISREIIFELFQSMWSLSINDIGGCRRRLFWQFMWLRLRKLQRYGKQYYIVNRQM